MAAGPPQANKRPQKARTFTEGKSPCFLYIYRMKKILFVLSFLLACKSAIGQHSNKKIIDIYIDPPGRRVYLPDTVLTCHADALYFPYEYGFGKYHFGYKIRWIAPEIDGTYYLSINQSQMFLYSGHDNPNPSYLFWMVKITYDQYNLINEKIKKSKAEFGKPYAGPEPYFTVEYKNPVTENLYTTLEDLVSLFNSGLPADQQIPLESSDEFKKIQPLRLISDEKELD